MTDDRFECAASVVVEGCRAAVRRDERGRVHVRSYGSFGVGWDLTREEALRLARDIRCELDDEALYDLWAPDYGYSVDSDEYTVSIRRDGEGTWLVLDSMDAEMLADWLEGS